MKVKGIIKINGRMMHYILLDDKITALSLNNTDLIDEIKEGEVYLTFDLKGNEQKEAEVTIIEDKKIVQAVFNQMLDAKNTYFKDFDDRLIVLEIDPKE